MTTNPEKSPESPSASPEVDEIYRKLEERAIAESNDLNRRVAHCRRCHRGEFLPTVGSGHPLADIVLLKYQPRYLEVSEGVAFFGRAGNAVLRSMERLGIDPLLLYGTNIIKCAGVEPGEAEGNCPGYVLEELLITRPKLVVVMGERTWSCSTATGRRGCANSSGCRARCRNSRRSAACWSRRTSTPRWTTRARRPLFWQAFRTLGDWFRDEPPY